MKFLSLFIFCWLLSSTCFSRVEISSFYFNQNNVELTESAKNKLILLQELISNNEFQIIEINSFSDLLGSKAQNETLCRKRMEKILDALQIQDDNINVNVFGNTRIPVNFDPKNWNRVDIYYHVGAVLKPIEIDIVESIPPEKDSIVVAPPMEPKTDLIEENKILVLPIKFLEGTYKVETTSIRYLEKLYKKLEDNPEYNAHFRGHICCEDKLRKSKKRAKVIYKYLKRKGISKERMTYEGRSNWEPLRSPEITGSDRAANRRVDVTLRKNTGTEI